MKKIVYYGCPHYKNIGDLACFEAIRPFLPSNVDIDVFYGNTYNFVDYKADLLIIGGGTVLNLLKEEKYKYHAYSGGSFETIYGFLDRDIPVVIWGSGVIPDINEDLRENVHPRCLKLLQAAKFVGVRGPISKQKLESIGYNDAEIVGDPAFLLSSPKQIVGKRIALNIGNAGGWVYGGPEVEDYMIEEAKKFIKLIQKDGFEVVLFSMCESDEEYAKKLENVQIKEFTYCYNDLMKFFDTCCCIIGSKLHASVLAAAAEVPFISLAYRDKCLDFALSLDLMDRTIVCNAPNLADQLRKKVRSYTSVKLFEFHCKITQYKKKYLEMHKEIQQQVLNILQDSS